MLRGRPCEFDARFLGPQFVSFLLYTLTQQIYVAASSVPQWSAVDDNFRVDKFYWYCRRLLPDGDAYTKETLDWIRRYDSHIICYRYSQGSRKMVDLKKTAKRKRRSLPDDDDEDPIALIHRQRTAAAALQQRTPERRR